MHAIGWSGAAFVLAGATTGGDGDTDELAFWTSPDGVTWTEGPQRSTGVVTDFVFDPAGAGIAVGYDGAAAAIWVTADGVRWSRSPDQPALQPLDGEGSIRLRHAAGTGDGYAAIGESGPWGVVLLSTDGVSWARSDAAPASKRVTLESIAGDEEGFVMTGHARNPWRNAIWTSADGRSWSEIEDPPEERARYGNRGLVIGGPRGWLVKSQTYEGDGLWTSVDGEDWAFVGEPDDPAGQIAALVAAPGRYVVIEPSAHCSSGVWSSLDARAWECSGGDSEPDGSIYDWKFAASDRTIVAVREVGTPWVAELSE
jgi:hypothetical protein